MTSSLIGVPSRSIATESPDSGNSVSVSRSQTTAIRWTSSSALISVCWDSAPVTVQKRCGYEYISATR